MEETSLDPAPAKVVDVIIKGVPAQAENETPTVCLVPTKLSIISSAFQVETVTLAVQVEGEDEGAQDPLLVAGEDVKEGSKGLSVSAPLMPKAIRLRYALQPEQMLLSTLIEKGDGVETEAHHSPIRKCPVS